MALTTNIFNIKKHNDRPEKGRILISEPYSVDKLFKRSVVLLTEDNEDGSVGFILNKPINMPISSVVQNFSDITAKLSLGGPVQQESLYYVHTLGNKLPNSIHVFDNLYWGGSFDILKMMIEAGEVDDYAVRFFVGYSGWQPNQLKGEMDRNSWLVSDIDVNHIMTDNSVAIWNKAVEKLDKDYSAWLNYPDNPSLN